MLSFTLLAATVVVSLVGVAVLCVVATRQPMYHPVAAGLGKVHFDPAADTQIGISCGSEKTTAGDWQSKEVSRLCDAETLLDQLEACQVADRELEIAGTNLFIVRWR